MGTATEGVARTVDYRRRRDGGAAAAYFLALVGSICVGAFDA